MLAVEVQLDGKAKVAMVRLVVMVAQADLMETLVAPDRPVQMVLTVPMGLKALGTHVC